MGIILYYFSFFICFCISVSHQSDNNTATKPVPAPETTSNTPIGVNYQTNKSETFIISQTHRRNIVTSKATPKKNVNRKKKPGKNRLVAMNTPVAKKPPAARNAVNLNPTEKQIVNEMSWPLKIMFYKEALAPTSTVKPSFRRRVGMQPLVLGKQGRKYNDDDDCDDNDKGKHGKGNKLDENGNPVKDGDENEDCEDGDDKNKKKKGQIDMENDDTLIKLKLFTLMDETARDCDLKVRRADMIRSHYNNNTAFEVGYLMGSISDKHRHMTDTATTLKRLYKEWQPLEHINAYEQVANQAIEISHLIETAKHAIKTLDEKPKNTTHENDPQIKRKRFLNINRQLPNTY